MNQRPCPTCSGTGWIDSSLPDPPANHRSRRTAQGTTVEAAETLRLSDCRTHHLNILSILYSDSLTDTEIHQKYNWSVAPASASTLRARRSELMHADMVCDSGHRGKSETGRPSIRWEITDRGRDAIYFHRQRLS